MSNCSVLRVAAASTRRLVGQRISWEVTARHVWPSMSLSTLPTDAHFLSENAGRHRCSCVAVTRTLRSGRQNTSYFANVDRLAHLFARAVLGNYTFINLKFFYTLRMDTSTSILALVLYLCCVFCCELLPLACALHVTHVICLC